MSEPRPLFVVPLQVRWGDMDAFNHVNNAAYATYVEEARLRWFATFEGGWMDADCGPVLAAQTINYRLPIEWPATLQIELFLERSGNSSLGVGFRILADDAARTLHADGSTVLVWIDRRLGRSTPLPAAVRRAIESG
jgi:acyl-CoA thioester hydrolase